MYDKLKSDHRELGEIIRELRMRADAESWSDPAGLARCRWRLARVVTTHLALEDTHIYGPLAHDPRPEAVAISRRFKQELSLLLGDFNAHIAQWSAEAVMADWTGYTREVKALLHALEMRIECEEAEHYPLLAIKRAPQSRCAA